MTTGLEFILIFTAGVLSGIAALYGYRALVSRWIGDEPETERLVSYEGWHCFNGTWYHTGGAIHTGNVVTELRPPSGPKGAA